MGSLTTRHARPPAALRWPQVLNHLEVGYRVPEDQFSTPAQLTATAHVHRVAFKTDIGRSHRINQDAGGVRTCIRPDGVAASLLVVADGVSAGRRSEEVSNLVAEMLLERVGRLLEDGSRSVDALVEDLADQVRRLNHEAATRPNASPSSADATTLVAAVCVGARGGGVWVGDSRAYLIDDHRATQLTRDHSWAEGAISGGFMSAEQAALDPRAHMITRWLGPPDRDDPGVETFAFEVQPGNVVLCCSDGLYGYFAPPASSADEMAAIVSAHGSDLEAATDVLVDRALERGGHDNITVAALRFDSDSEE